MRDRAPRSAIAGISRQISSFSPRRRFRREAPAPRVHRRHLRSEIGAAGPCRSPCRRRRRRRCREPVDLLLGRDAAGGGRRRAVVASRTASIASRSMPCISPSTSTLVKRNSPKNGSSARTASTGVIGRRVRQPSIDDLSAARVDGGDQAVRRRRARASARANSRSGRAVAEERRSDDHLSARRRRAAPPRARRCARRRRRGRAAGRRSTRPARGCRRRSSPRRDRSAGPSESARTADPAVDVVGRDREPLALDELDDAAALKIDGRNQHEVRAVTGHARARADTPSARRRRAR